MQSAPDSRRILSDTSFASDLESTPARSRTPLLRVILSMTSVKLSPGFFRALSLS